MTEATTTRATKTAMQRAHEERAQAMRNAWHWLLSSRRNG